MRDVMHSYESVGLSAPQIGVPLKIFMIEFSEKISKKFSPDIQKSREMAIIPLKVSWYGPCPVFITVIFALLCCAYIKDAFFTTKVIITVKENNAKFVAQY
jgi:hypothetical protein